MAQRKHDPLQIKDITSTDPFNNEKFKGFVIYWASIDGFGSYTIYKPTHEDDPDTWYADSEHMDTNDNKQFLKRLLCELADRVVIES